MDSFNISATIAAYKWKLKLQRYYVIKNISNIRLRNKQNDVVYVWPPYVLSTDESDLSKLLLNFKHYLVNLNINVIYYVHSNKLTKHVYSAVNDKLINIEATNNVTTQKDLKNARYCLLWRIDGAQKSTSLHPNLYLVDEKKEISCASEWLRLIYDLYISRDEIPTRSVNIPNYPVKTCAILGSGPSINHFYDENNDWDAWIGCNFLVCDPKLRNAGRPFALCILDPDNFSSMECMRPLWEGAFELLRGSSAILITAYNYAPFIELNFPEDIKAKCLYVKTLGNNTFSMKTNYNLLELKVTPYGNVFTDLMLPVAVAISKKIVIYGCDGSPPESKGNFPKSELFNTYDDQFTIESNSKYTDSFYKTIIDKHSLYTRFVVNECLRQGVDISIRCHSWNKGLQCLPVANQKAKLI